MMGFVPGVASIYAPVLIPPAPWSQQGLEKLQQRV